MSGGSGGGGADDWRTPSGTGPPDSARCMIVEQTVLSSPVPAVVAVVSVGQVLDVLLETTPRKRLVVQTTGGAVAGAITSARLVDFIECIEAGFDYVAEVLAVNGGRVDIEVRRK